MPDLTPPRRRRFRFSLPAIAAVTAVLLAGGMWGAYSWFKYASEMLPNCYCLDAATLMVIEHMRANEGAWPDGWDALDDDYATVKVELRGLQSPEEIRSRVDIDWSADPKELVRATAIDGRPPFKVIWLRDGRSYHLSEPNQTILDYLLTGKSPLDRGIDLYVP